MCKQDRFFWKHNITELVVQLKWTIFYQYNMNHLRKMYKCIPLKFHFSLTSFKDLNFAWLELKFPDLSLTISWPLATMGTVMRRFGLKTGIDFAHFGLESPGHGFRGNYGSVWTYLSFQFQMNKRKREIRVFEMDFKKSFFVGFSLIY